MLSPPVEVTPSALELAQDGLFADVPALFAPQLRSLVAPEALATAWLAELDKQGSITEIGTPLTEPVRTGAVVVKVPVTCERGGFALIATVTETGQLAGLQLAPPSAAEPIAPWEPPRYADPVSFDEHEVTLGSGQREVGGTVSLPHRTSAGPAIVLLAGSGSLDRDETIGRNKPLKDIAWGLASRGVAVLRLDKVTYTHANELKHAEQFTLSDEYLPQALAAVELPNTNPPSTSMRLWSATSRAG